MVIDNGIVDFNQTELPYKDLQSIIEHGADDLEKVKAFFEGVSPHYALSEVTLLAPIPHHRKC